MARTLLATLIGLVFLAAYLVLAVTGFDLVAARNGVVQAVYFLGAGLLWVAPIWWLMLWAARPRLRRLAAQAGCQGE